MQRVVINGMVMPQHMTEGVAHIGNLTSLIACAYSNGDMDLLSRLKSRVDNIGICRFQIIDEEKKGRILESELKSCQLLENSDANYAYIGRMILNGKKTIHKSVPYANGGFDWPSFTMKSTTRTSTPTPTPPNESNKYFGTDLNNFSMYQ